MAPAATPQQVRHKTFLRRRRSLFKKAFELQKLCKVKVAVIIEDHNGEYSLYRPTKATSWPPSMAAILTTCPVTLLPCDFQTQRDVAENGDIISLAEDKMDIAQDASLEAMASSPERNDAEQSLPEGSSLIEGKQLISLETGNDLTVQPSPSCVPKTPFNSPNGDPTTNRIDHERFLTSQVTPIESHVRSNRATQTETSQYQLMRFLRDLPY